MLIRNYLKAVPKWRRESDDLKLEKRLKMRSEL